MKKALIVIAIVAVIAVVGFFVVKPMLQSAEDTVVEVKSNLTLNTAEDITTFIDKLYEGNENLFGSLMTQAVDPTDNDLVASMTGLENANDVQFCVVSEPMMSSQAYSLVIVKVKEGVDANAVAKKMNENINMRKWLCVEAEKAYTTSSGDIICLVMSSEEMAKPVYEKFKTLAGGIGEEFVRAAEVVEMPDDMMPGMDEVPAFDGEPAV